MAVIQQKVKQMTNPNSQEKKTSKAMQALSRARALNRSRRDFGLDGIRHHVRDVDGDWLENWSEGVSVSLNPEV